jgi:hypothetical protein
MYADDTTIHCLGPNVDTVIAHLNLIMAEVSKWSSINKLTIHPTKTEAMILQKSPFTGPLPPILFGSGFIKFVDYTTMYLFRRHHRQEPNLVYTC